MFDQVSEDVFKLADLLVRHPWEPSGGSVAMHEETTHFVEHGVYLIEIRHIPPQSDRVGHV